MAKARILIISAVLGAGVLVATGSPASAACQAHQTVSTNANWSGNCTTSNTQNKQSDLTTAIQSDLTLIGYLPGPVDGDFGPATRSAVIAFQKANFPNQPSQWDGVVGPQTWSKLDSFLHLNTSSSSFYDFYPGGSGAEVFRLYRTGANAGDWFLIRRSSCGGPVFVPMDSTRSC